MTALSLATIREAPKVLLHDHLDGGVRPQTVIDLAAEQGYDRLPTTDPDELAAWFVEGAARRSLPRYLEPFEHTVGVMQTAEALTRIAAECAEDLADDGVVYAEIRFAPELHLDGGLDLDEVVELMEARSEGLVALDDALNELAEVDESMARIVELRFFGGMTHPEIARALGQSLRSVERSWSTARAWLYAQLDPAAEGEER